MVVSGKLEYHRFKCISSVDAVTRLRNELLEHHSSNLGRSKVISLLHKAQNGPETRLSIEYQWFPLG